MRHRMAAPGHVLALWATVSWLGVSAGLASHQSVHQSQSYLQPAAAAAAAAEQLGPQFTCGKLYYRTLHLDKQRDVLYVGAMDNIFRVNLANVNKTRCLEDAIKLDPLDTSKCISRGKSENFECRNHVRVIQPMSKTGDRLYICGTNSFNPRHYMVHAGNLSISSEPFLGHGPQATCECPFDPEDNSTAVWVEKGNPFDLPALYTGTYSDFNKADPLIFRSVLYNQSTWAKIDDGKRSQRYDSNWIDKPNFIGSFEIGDYVYFFFRENAYEFINCGKSIYSRVARVCKRDSGHKLIYEKVWTTYLKARLNCSIPGEFPFYFDEIQSIYRNPLDDKKFHAVFTTSGNGLTGSAICTFSLEAIQEAFNGKFKEQKSSDHAWLPVPSFKLNPNEPRPGTCVDDQLSDQMVTFVRSHPLMDSAVANDNGRPIFYRRDIIFTKIVVDIVEIDGVRYTVYFAGTNTGHVYKIVEWYPQVSSLGAPDLYAGSAAGLFAGGGGAPSGAGSAGGERQAPGAAVQSSLVEVFEATVPEPVRAMEISGRHKSLYVASDTQIRQINLLNCKRRHDNCMQCIRDPYCGWDRSRLECRHLSASDLAANLLIQDVTNESPDSCHAVLKHKDVHVTWGQSVHLPCRFNGFIQESQDLQQLLGAQQRRQLNHERLYGPGSSQALGLDGTEALQAAAAQAGHSHGLAQPVNFIQWYYHHNPLAPGYQVLQHRDRFVLAADQGLVILNANEPGRYQCRLGNQIIHSYNLIIDTKTCAAPNELEFRRVYADWCREIERYKSAYKSWHAKQNRCQALTTASGAGQQQQPAALYNSPTSNHNNNNNNQMLIQQPAQGNLRLDSHDIWSSSAAHGA